MPDLGFIVGAGQTQSTNFSTILIYFCVRLILAALTLMVVQSILRKSILPKQGEWKKLMISSLMICFGFYATQTFAMQFVDSGLSAVLVFTMPIFIAVLAHYFLNEYSK